MLMTCVSYAKVRIRIINPRYNERTKKIIFLFNNNKLRLNANKSTFITFHVDQTQCTKNKHIAHKVCSKTNVYQFSTTNVLDIIIDETMHVTMYITCTCTLIICSLLIKICHYLPIIIRKRGYFIFTESMSFIEETYHPSLLSVILYLTYVAIDNCC